MVVRQVRGKRLYKSGDKQGFVRNVQKQGKDKDAQYVLVFGWE